eukprot:CAMPEP_0174265228 /NCGR_PEP_ID=MMETSP0439-20130205/25700_1 /TAXON_ID=0 /ORGANISM="Stereomyxa ramosa, Strain Chinc5" /LENGTH=693 /DNA_ID=CAMNT_0015351583 /DNA_START=91 /DNA_END=2172 /DNA_ORIENTATION=+
MNGEYVIANPNSRIATFSTDYGAKNAEFFDVYSPPIQTVYAEVYWTMMDPVKLPAEIVKRFDNKVMAVIGYEVDQVRKTPQGDVSVPIFWAYNHHYEAYLVGKDSQLVKKFVQPGQDTEYGYNHGANFYWDLVPKNGTNADPKYPTGQFFSEGNGGEFRKSFHGYPKGFAQLIQSPTEFHIQPMQIDTHNRDYNGTGFKAGLLPKSSAAPPDAHYSGLLECPCTTRIHKQWNTTYGAITSGTCQTVVTNATECFVAATQVGSAPDHNYTVSNSSLPYGCFVIHTESSVSAYLNTDASSQTSCGGGDHRAGNESSLVVLGLDLREDQDVVTITMTGPANVWFGVGFNASQMADLPYAIIVDGEGGVTERKLGNHDPGTQLSPTQVKVVSDTTNNGLRTVVMKRAFKGVTPDHYSFGPASSIPFINALGYGPKLAYHKNKTSATINLHSVNSPTCVCNEGTKGTINGLAFEKNCAPEPMGDLIQQKNPTCWIQTYQGGLRCCHHQNILLDADQKVDPRQDEYHLKFRFWFQNYTESPTPSHQDLPRVYFQTEAYAGEYDVMKCPESTSPEDCEHSITARFKVSDMIKDQQGKGINLVYAGGHCHAPSCISMELFNADTGELICKQTPIFGKSNHTFDEEGYIAIPPCLWGPEEEGLQPPTFLSYDTNLNSVKINNATYNHYGEMASWQMRAVYVY